MPYYFCCYLGLIYLNKAYPFLIYGRTVYKWVQFFLIKLMFFIFDSKLTMYSSCTPQLISAEWVKPFLHHLNVHKHNSDIVVRICFALGNLVARSDDLRTDLFFYQNKGDNVAGMIYQGLHIHYKFIHVTI